MFESVEETINLLQEHDYIVEVGLATCLFLATKLGKPIFLEGEPGVGKTEIAKVLSDVLNTPLIRLQCYEGLDVNHAVYEWNYPRQLLEIQARQMRSNGDAPSTDDIFTEKFLLKRALLQAIDQGQRSSPVLLIDELDRADEEFESFLLELLSDFQITIPEIGTVRAKHRPIVIVTSNRTREIHDALKRRCVYYWIDYPSREKEMAILRLKLPGIPEELARQVVDFVQLVRGQDIYKAPGVSESLDWAEALAYLNVQSLNTSVVNATIGFILKYQDDVSKIQGVVTEQLLERVFDESH
ncbi:MAG TPA: MoxR family ATPase [Aggregatilineales bacterium]|nr:MoxR family ATPase [Aggregatilineales bacterium]